MKLNKNILIFISFFLYVISNSLFCVKYSLSSYVEYLVNAILIMCCLWTFFKEPKDKNKIKIFMIICFMFSIGIVLQNMGISIKLRLVFTMIALSIYIMLSSNFIDSYKSIKASCYGMFFGIIISLILAIIAKIPLFDPIYDNSFWMLYSKGFNGGIIYKNYFGSILLSIIIGLFCYPKKTYIEYLMIIISFILFYFSGSKGSMVLLLAYLMLNYLKKFNYKIKSKITLSKPLKRILIIMLFILLFIVFSFIFDNYLLSSSTYSYRIRGVVNYFDYVKDKPFYFLFGYSEMAYSENGEYVRNIITFLTSKGYKGYEGTYEMGFINTFIKNGLIGLMAFIVCYVYLYKKLKETNNENSKNAKIILIVLLLSSLVESYVCNIHCVFGVWCYLVINGLINFKEE